MPMQQSSPVTLSNCEDEPIHLPGSIQPHGALLAFDLAGGLIAWSENAGRLLGLAPSLQATLASLALPDGVGEAVAECLDSIEHGEAPAVALEVDTVRHAFRLHRARLPTAADR